ncbi:MAG: hypothetical protein K2Q26_14145 [Bdellovibrionales bacterium]|nr:hypothetical protein [Bdellovibrionales bacterium]
MIKHQKLLIILLILISPLLLSLISQFNLISPYRVTFEIATMLTPVGIFKNYYWEETILTPYYSVIMPNQGRDHNLFIYFYILIQFSLAGFFLRRLGRRA